MIRTNNYDDNEYTAFILNESRVRTDDAELDEFSPESIFGLDTDCMGMCFSDADPGL